MVKEEVWDARCDGISNDARAQAMQVMVMVQQCKRVGVNMLSCVGVRVNVGVV